ncbi:MAG: bifunctional oligoribonuclease/PAP phosphatase NrnA [Acetilactobacillus jinshanensis]
MKDEKMTVQQKILNAIQKYSTIILQRHKRPDPDAIGSQMGLAEMIKKTYPEKQVYCVGKQYQGFNWLGQEDQIKPSVYQGALVIVTDTANQPRIDGSHYKDGDMLIKIDHHPNDDAYGDVQWVNPKASSASEMVYDLCTASRRLKIDAETGRLIYAGIVGDTGRFKYPSTSSHTFYVASQLAKLNFSISHVNKKEEEIDFPMAHLCAYLYTHLKIMPSGAAYLVINDKTLSALKLSDENTSAIVPLPGNIRGVKCWIIFVQQPDKTYRLRIRSNGPAINGLAKHFGGGGHALASGAMVKDISDVKRAIHELNQIAKNYKGDMV